MTQEDKELLLKDLCARLPYGVKIELMPITRGKCTTLTPIILHDYFISNDVNYLPYLRPMSSMSEEERNEYTSLCNRQDIDTPTWSKIIWHDTYKSIDWLNKKMFAYRTIDGKDMFELGLAIEAPEGMYNLEKK